MQLKIEKNTFCKLEGISNIKNHLEKLSQVSIEESKASGTVEMNISYNDYEGMECFKTLEFPFELDLESLKILEILVGHVNVFLVEGQGLDIQYELVIHYLPVEEKAEEIKVIEEQNIEVEEPKEDLDQIKSEMMEYYEDKLANHLPRKDQVITTKTHESVESFLDFFDSNKNYYKLKCLYIESEQELESIAKEYNVKLETLLAGYDRESHKVLFSIN